MKDNDLRLIASLVDWPESNKLMVKTFYNTFGAVLHEKFNEFEESKKTIKEYIRNNFSDKQLPKTPKRYNPSVKLLGQIQQMEMANFNSDDSDDEQRRVVKCQARIPQRILQQLENIGLHNPPKRGQLQPPSTSHANATIQKTMSGDTAGTSLKTLTTPVLSASASCLTPKLHKPFASSSKAVNLVLSASTSVSSPISRPAAMAPTGLSAVGRAPPAPLAPVSTAAALEQQRRLREKEELAAKRREEALKNKAERTKRDHDERQRRVDQNNRLRMEQLQKQKQEAEEKRERLRKFRQEQEDLERMVRSPAAKSRKLGTPRSGRKPQTAEPKCQQPEPAPKPLFGAKRNSLQKRQRSPSTADDGSTSADEQRLQQLALPAVHQSAGDVHVDGGDFMHVDDDEVVDDNQPDDVDGEEEMADAGGQEDGEEHYDYTGEDGDGGEREEAVAEKFMTPKSQSSIKATSAQQSLASTQCTPHPPAAAAVLTDGRGHSYDMTPDKVFLPSTKDNYNVDDLESGDETDNEENPRKQIPKWASKSSLMLKMGKLRTLVTPEQCERHFGKIRDPDINNFFGKYEKKYGVRSSSAIWNSPMSDPTPGVARYAN